MMMSGTERRHVLLVYVVREGEEKGRRKVKEEKESVVGESRGRRKKGVVGSYVSSRGSVTDVHSG